jgi:putative transposase
MPNYRRSHAKGATFFFTVVTYHRQKVLTHTSNRQLLRAILKEVKSILPFTIDAWVLLPDHIHCIWTLPQNDNNFSKRWGMIKAKFSKQAKHLFNPDWMNSSKQKHRESTLWQRRFREHQIRDDLDFQRHVEYIHYNPVKHGLVQRAADWPYSTFHKYVRQGIYPENWGTSEFDKSKDGFGE